MSNTVIKVEDIGKLYRLGEIGTGTISHDLNRWFARVRGKEDPFAKVGEVNDRASKGSSDYVWALKNIDFSVRAGEAVGIIGRNGAGKSTLLKLLSKVTTPTTGTIKVKGRIASLLEVGTGFHPELTGRENIFLNGAILGMTKKEITRKFDEIVAFAGVERYIDTPVKRYSSGMYVRLAFAVAAHLESEILIVDEVLAVGDSDFQKKCLGKMGEVTHNEGRTILFVSHNMAAVSSLCSRAIVVDKGQTIYNGEVAGGIFQYLELNRKNSTVNLMDRKDRAGNQKLKFVRSWIENEDGTPADQFVSGQNLYIVAELMNTTKEVIKGNLNIAFALYDYLGYQITDLSNSYILERNFVEVGSKITVRCHLPSLALNDGTYRYNVYCSMDKEVMDGVEYVGYFQVDVGNYYGTGKLPDKSQGAILFNQNWEITCAE
jgi:lipopolysaccharide transport system ATP-binding protein